MEKKIVLGWDMYTKVFGHQTTTDISAGRNVPHLTGGNGDFSIKE